MSEKRGVEGLWAGRLVVPRGGQWQPEMKLNSDIKIGLTGGRTRWLVWFAEPRSSISRIEGRLHEGVNRPRLLYPTAQGGVNVIVCALPSSRLSQACDKYRTQSICGELVKLKNSPDVLEVCLRSSRTRQPENKRRRFNTAMKVEVRQHRAKHCEGG